MLDTAQAQAAAEGAAAPSLSPGLSAEQVDRIVAGLGDEQVGRLLIEALSFFEAIESGKAPGWMEWLTPGGH